MRGQGASSFIWLYRYAEGSDGRAVYSEISGKTYPGAAGRVTAGKEQEAEDGQGKKTNFQDGGGR